MDPLESHIIAIKIAQRGSGVRSSQIQVGQWLVNGLGLILIILKDLRALIGDRVLTTKSSVS